MLFLILQIRKKQDLVFTCYGIISAVMILHYWMRYDFYYRSGPQAAIARQEAAARQRLGMKNLCVPLVIGSAIG
jgi:hypothetical protein